MKKIVVILLCLILPVMFLASCAADNANIAPAAGYGRVYFGGQADADGVPAPFATEAFEIAQAAPGSAPATFRAGAVYDSAPGGSNGAGLVPITPPVSDTSLAEKIIYTVSADIETLDYERTIEQVYQLMAFNGAFIESSFVGGINLEHTFHGWNTLRHARFTLRVPTNRLNAMTTSLDTLGNVATLSSDAENITQQFSDTSSRLNSLRVQEERLLDMLGRAENIEDMLAIEDRMSGVRFQIESLTSTIRNWQTQIDYSTLHLFIREVEEYTVVVEDGPALTYWQQIGYGIADSARGIARFFMALFMWIAVNLPVLILLAVIAAVVIAVVNKRLKKKRQEV
ncbi:MAG: DUF4349 domain-containing protein [Oscillospiraceae bacterium]|nr:DUF4349 domain-containing protein [Oscillospiraceae bacterium]